MSRTKYNNHWMICSLEIIHYSVKINEQFDELVNFVTTVRVLTGVILFISLNWEIYSTGNRTGIVICAMENIAYC